MLLPCRQRDAQLSTHGLRSKPWTPGRGLFSLKIKKSLQTAHLRAVRNESRKRKPQCYINHISARHTRRAVEGSFRRPGEKQGFEAALTDTSNFSVFLLLLNYTLCPDPESWLRDSQRHLLLVCLPVSAQRTHPNLRERKRRQKGKHFKIEFMEQL